MFQRASWSGALSQAKEKLIGTVENLDSDDSQAKRLPMGANLSQIKMDENQGGVDLTDIGNMPSGDYMIHVYVTNVKHLKPDDVEDSIFNLESGDKLEPFDALVECQCLGKSEFSTTMTDTIVDSDTGKYLGEHFFFEPRGITSDQIQGEILDIKVLKKGTMKNQLVGHFDIDLAKIYFRNDDHALFDHWIALFKPNSVDSDEIKGLVKVSIAVRGPNDPSVQLADRQMEVLEDPAKQEILMPSSLCKVYKQINIKFLQGQHFCKMDEDDSWCQAYVQLEFRKMKYQTRVAQYDTEKHKADLDYEFCVPVQWPSSVDRLILVVMDDDKINEKSFYQSARDGIVDNYNYLRGIDNKDDTFGSIVLSIKDLVKRFSTEEEFCEQSLDKGLIWLNVYGSPNKSFNSEVKHQMNENPELASMWKGRILVHIEVCNTSAPEVKSDYLDDEIKGLIYNSPQLKQALELKKYEIIAEVGSGIKLPTSKDYKIRLQIGANSPEVDYCQTTEAAKSQKHRFNRWAHRFEPMVMKTPYQSLEEMDRVYAYLLLDEQPVCFWKGCIKDFDARDESGEVRDCDHDWYSFVNDKNYGEVDKNNYGIIQFKLAINSLAKNKSVNWTEECPNWKKELGMRDNFGKVRCFIYQCRDLPAGDADGKSDAFVKAYNFSQEKKERQDSSQTAVISDNLNPIFYEALDISVSYEDNIELMPPFILDIYDRDQHVLGSQQYDFLGRAIIKMNDEKTQASFADCRDKEIKIPDPEWHDIRGGNNQNLPVCGQILCSFVLYNNDQQLPKRKEVNLGKQIKNQQCDVKIHVLGLRDLHSFGIIPVTKPFIKFNIKSLLPPQKSMPIDNIKTDPTRYNKIGQNVNINTMIQFSLSLPVNKNFCPKLPCTVYDQILKGIMQPKIGVFDIDLGEIIENYDDRKVGIKDSSVKLVKKLERILADQSKSEKDSVQLSKEDESDKQSQNNFTRMSWNLLKQDVIKKSEKIAKNVIIENDNGQIDLVKSLDQLIEEILPQSGLNSEDFEEVKQQFKKITQTIENIDVEDEKQEKKRTKTLQKVKSQIIDIQKSRLQNMTNGSKKQKKAMATKVMIEQIFINSLKSYQEQNRQKQKEERKIKQEKEIRKMVKEGRDAHKTVLMPNYELVDGIVQETLIPDESTYYEVGYDDPKDLRDILNKEKEGQKHYRKYFEDELENNKQIIPHEVFYKAILKRGQTRGIKPGLFETVFHNQNFNTVDHFASSEKIVGVFKGHIVIDQNEDEDQDKNEDDQQSLALKALRLIESIHQAKFNEPLQTQLDDLPGIEEGSEAYYVRLLSKIILDQEAKNAVQLKLEMMNIPDVNGIMNLIAHNNFESVMLQMLKSPVQAIVRFYLLEGFDLVGGDETSQTDPYLIIKCGNTQYNKRDEYQLDEPNPQFFEMKEFNVQFPGASPLIIEAYDYDILFGDDFIGKTVIDLDDRYFSSFWRALIDKPIEYRELYHQSTSQSQGTIKCWLEIIDRKDKKAKINQRIWDIHPEPVRDYQLRVCVYNCKGVKSGDIEDASDVFVRAQLGSGDEENQQETDTHWRCTDHKPSFNYRLLFNTKAPKKTVEADKNGYLLEIVLYDRDLLKSNDFLANFELDLKPLFDKCRRAQRTINLDQKFADQHFEELDLEFSDLDGEEENSFWLEDKENESQIRIDVRLVPGLEAERQPVGAGRQEPNHSPNLPEPRGRLEFSMNPLNMLGQLVGPEFKAWLATYCCCIICIMICLLICFQVGSVLLAMFLSRMIYGS